MTTTGSSPAGNSNQKQTAIFASIIGVLLLAVIFLGISNYRSNKVKTQLSTQYDESEQLKAELEEQYLAALSDLEEMRGSNEELNALIETQKEELTIQKEKIDKLIRNDRDLTKARTELKNLNQKVEQYIAEVNQLRQENEILSTNNAELSDNLTNAIETTEMLISEKQSLESTKETLEKKVKVASVIKVEEIDITGMKIKNNGQKIKKSLAKNVTELKICFNTTINKVVDAGTEKFYVRIINPLGETMAIENMGSGVFKNQATGDEMRFTQLTDTDYKHDEETLCMTWAPNQAFQSGTYELEVYNKGHLAGNASFQLK